MKKTIVLMAMAMLLMSSLSPGDIVTIEEDRHGFYGTSGNPSGWNSNYFGTLKAGGNYAMYLHADMPSISLGAGESIQINSATISYYVYVVNDYSATAFICREITEDWTQDGGVSGAAPTLAAETLDTGQVVNSAGWFEFDVTSAVQSWVDGTTTNYGVGVHRTGGWAIQGVLVNDSEKMPYYTVDYDIVPEPATLALLGMGAVSLIVRRKRK